MAANFSMGSIVSKFRSEYTVIVKTGDHQGAGTDANIYVLLVNADGKRSQEIHLDVKWQNDFQAGSTNEFPVRNLADFGDIAELELWRTKRSADKWYVEWIKVKGRNKEYVFPMHRWIKPEIKMKFQEHDSVLPQFDRFPQQRKQELEEKRKTYAFAPAGDGLPSQVKEFPDTESFSNDYEWGIVTGAIKDKLDGTIIGLTSGRWDSLDDLGNVYKGSYPVPKGKHRWRSDIEFGKQRLVDCNPGVIQLCTHIPENFGVTNEMLGDLLEGLTIESAIEKKRLFIVDYKLLKDLPTTDPMKTVCSPLALFYLQNDAKLMPVAIQLFQDKSDDNPVFLSSDHEYTWMFAKMWFNNADASYHQSASHLGMTHLVMESIVAATHSYLSPSHPLFRLMASHFLYLIAINKLAIESLVNEGGWVDRTMAIGRTGMFEIVKRRFKTWRMDIDGNFPKELESRGVSDPDVLPNYHFRDDGLLMWHAISEYVDEVVHKCYDTSEKISQDHELQGWRKALSSPVTDGGCNIQGVPGDGSFKNPKEIAETVTSIVFTSSVMHAAVNFGQYDNYGFPPHYPASIEGQPPKNKDPKTEDDILEALPDKQATLDVMEVTKLLSEKGTNGLGDFEVDYQFDPISTEAVQKFRDGLKNHGKTINERNNDRYEKYTYLHPTEIPNAISI
ncbi:allene oxide synthase-lipoxygenase protein-like [Antedon mediterranea]|uniref:allene oxide synthase-lipoxygenase protein-like n=1 Tax=Antedon mediterranea TaxID=105859 RepID=UPI003AF9C0A8